MSIVWPLLCCWYHTKLVEFVELGDYAYANSYQKWTSFYLSFSIVGSCLFPAILIQICCSCVWFYPMCSYVQNTVGANITQICLRSIFGKEHLQICGGKPKCKVIWPKQDTCGKTWARNKLLFCLSCAGQLELVSLETKIWTSQNRCTTK